MTLIQKSILGEKQYFFDGSDRNERSCKCKRDNSCDNELDCNCYASHNKVWAKDEGNISLKQLLPITGFGFVPKDHGGIRISLGDLTCNGRRLNNFNTFK